MEGTTEQPINNEEPKNESAPGQEIVNEVVDEKPKKPKKEMTEKQKEVRMKNLQKALQKRKENKELREKEVEISKLEIQKKKINQLEQLELKKATLSAEISKKIPEKKKTERKPDPEPEPESDYSSSSSEEEVIVRRKKPHKKKIPVYDEDEYVNLVRQTATEKLKERLNNERVKMAMMSLFN